MAPLPSDTELEQIAIALGRTLEADGFMLATAESCTGGWVGRVVTAVPGSSIWFDRGFITYSNAAKTEMLGVSIRLLAEHGAVSEASARAMAEGALAHSQAQVAIAITGVAGPGGDTQDKPVGTVWFAWARRGGPTQAERHQLEGDRDAVRRQSVAIALGGMRRLVAKSAQ